MRRTNREFNHYVGNMIGQYRGRMKYTMERMSETLNVSTRCYQEQEKGRMGFSGQTICRFLLSLKDDEILSFIHGLRKSVWKEDEM